MPFDLRRDECRRGHSGRACAVVGGSAPHAVSPSSVFDVGGGVCVCLCVCMPACAGAVTPRSAVAKPTPRAAPRAAGECPPIATMRAAVCFARGECRRTRSGRACAAVGGSVLHAVSPPHVFDVGAGVCVCLCACMPTSQAKRESPIAAKIKTCCRFICIGVSVVARTERVCLHSRRFVGPSRSRRHACLPWAPASASTFVCAHACVRGRSYATVGGGGYNIASSG